ncbi:hypothetical protein D3C72_983390 [compost metagenome]
MANSGERPRRLSPEPVSFCRVGEKEGDRVATASITEPLMATCSAKALRSMTSTVIGRALAGRMVRAAVTTTSATVLTSGSCRVAWAAAVEAKAVPASRVETTTRPDDRRSDRAGEAKGMRGRLQKKASRLNAIASDLQYNSARRTTVKHPIRHTLLIDLS